METQDPCGSELARESIGSACNDAGCADAFASKLAPTGILGFQELCIQRRTIVRASLLAKTPAYPTSLQGDPPLSRAGSLPQGSWVSMSFAFSAGLLWERACSRRRRNIQHHCKLIHRFREQARSHRDLGFPGALHSAQDYCGSELAREGVGTSSIIAS